MFSAYGRVKKLEDPIWLSVIIALDARDAGAASDLVPE